MIEADHIPNRYRCSLKSALKLIRGTFSPQIRLGKDACQAGYQEDSKLCVVLWKHASLFLHQMLKELPSNVLFDVFYCLQNLGGIQNPFLQVAKQDFIS